MEEQIAKGGGVPRHIAIIMDGNGRWAQAQGQSRIMGHRAGADAVRKVVEAASKRGVKVLTLFAFSSENWKRPQIEVNALMRLFAETIQLETPNLKSHNIKTVVVGDTSRFSTSLQESIDELQAATVDCTGLVLQIAANYGGRWDLLQVTRALAMKCAMGLMDPSAIDEKVITSYLSVADDVDLLIRTGGEKRISNFLLWQAAYSEVYFSDVLWPDFDAAQLDLAIDFFNSRERRFGMTSEQVKNQEDFKC
ncbi:MAG: di-trans,poly-cis-decaprenylcistransferase [Succinivibrio sp.]|nr:di-trans,poly-cis-decaprenylcistransferase [Succinivibrio sp.]